MHRFKIRDDSTVADRIKVLKGELAILAGERSKIPQLCHDLVSTRYCQFTAILAEATMSHYGDNFDQADHDYVQACDELARRWPRLSLPRLNAIVTEYRRTHLFDELVDS